MLVIAATGPAHGGLAMPMLLVVPRVAIQMAAPFRDFLQPLIGL